MKTIYRGAFGLLFILSVLLVQCKKSSDTPVAPKSSTKGLTNPIIDGILSATSTYDASTSTYTLTVPSGTAVTTLKLNFTLSDGATANPTSGSIQNFSNPVAYTVTAQDGSTQRYIIKLLVLPPSVPVNTGKVCLVSKIEDPKSGDYFSFLYDSQNRIIQVDVYTNDAATTSGTKVIYMLKFVYDNSGSITDATFSDKNTLFYSYKYFYSNGKFVRFAYKDERRGGTGSDDILTNTLNMITKYPRSTGCGVFVYTDGALSKEVDCTTGTTIYTDFTNGSAKNILLGQINRPAFLYTFSLFIRNFDKTNLFTNLYGVNTPDKISLYWYPGSYVYQRSTITNVLNVDGFPTFTTIYFEPQVRSDFPNNSTFQAKITYTNCQ